MRNGGVLVLVLLGPAAALCQEQELKQAITQCADIDDISDRLVCYDSLARGVAQSNGARRATPQSSVVESSTPGQWIAQVVKDPIDDMTTVGLSLVGNELQARLVLRCRQRKLDVLLSWRGRFIGATEPIVWTRLGDAKAEKKRWSLSSDHKAAFLPGDTRVFVRQLLAVDRLVVQTDHFAQGRITDEFDVHTLKDAMGPLIAECALQ